MFKRFFRNAISAVRNSRWNMSRVASDAPDQTATDNSITFIIAKPATPTRSKRSCDTGSFEGKGFKPDTRQDRHHFFCGQVRGNVHALLRQVNPRRRYTACRVQRPFNRPDASNAFDIWHRQGDAAMRGIGHC